MKVLSYLECDKNSYNYHQFLKKLWAKVYPDKILNNIEIFYSQPFKPELITELFKGWGLVHGRFWHHEKRVCIWIKGNYISYNRESSIKRPRTLDDFINDCQREEIELEWKHQQPDLSNS